MLYRGSVSSFLDRLRKTSQTTERECSPAPKGYEPISRTRPEDVFIVAYPKSGNTWFQNLVSGVFHGINLKWSPPQLVTDLVPDVYASKFYRRYSTPMFFKSHELPRADYRRVIYLLRDGRDAMVSYFHYLAALDRRKLDFLDLITGKKALFPCRWHEHVEAWNRNPHGAELLVIQYENLVRQPVAELERFCQFLGIARDRDFLEAVAGAAQFANLQAKEARLGLGVSSEWPAGKPFFRRGIIGSHKDEMPPDVLAAFLIQAGDTLRQHGYLPHDLEAECSPGGGQRPGPIPATSLSH